MNIGIDLDDVLMNLVEALCVFHNEKYGTNHTFPDVTCFPINALWNCSPEEAKEKITIFYDSHHHTEAIPVPGAIEAISTLSKENNLFIVTAKPDTIKEQTHAWLNKYFLGQFKDVYFTNHYQGDPDKRKPKSQVCKELNIDLFIEDSIDNARDVSSYCPVLLFDAPWNRSVELPTKVSRVHSWDEIVDKITHKNY